MSKLNCYKANAFVFIGTILFASGLFAQTEWTKYEDNPVLVNEDNAFLWDGKNVGGPCVLFDGTTYKMWFDGEGAKAQIGYATSTDGVTWTKYSDNPVLKVGESDQWDHLFIYCPVVIFDGVEYKMWYQGAGSSYLLTSSIGLATSPDGITWTKHQKNPVIEPGSDGRWDSGEISPGDVIFDGETYKMWYSGRFPSWGNIGYATSPDGLTWTKYRYNPVLGRGSFGAWDDKAVWMPDIMLIDSTYHMWYSGRLNGNYRLGYATSPDGVKWRKSADNPVLDVVVHTWESKWLSNPSVILQDDGLLQMWYMGASTWDETSKIGYATSMLDTTVSDVSRRSLAEKNKLPQEYTLSENYPNPFNPTTTIRYNLPVSTHIRLTIYDQLGRHVRTLVDVQQAAGQFQTSWNGLDEGGVPAAAGMYFCQMKTVNFTKVIKLALVK